MKILELPYIRFGRNKDGVTDFYTIQEQSPSLPQNIVAIFRDRITKSVQWESSEETAKYSDCFLIWCTNDSNFLFAKLADGGSDSLKRNHSMQMDAVYLTDEQLPDNTYKKAEFFASLCFPSVWENWDKNRILQPVDENEQNVTELSEKIFVSFLEKASSVNSLFLASHPYFTPCGVDQIVHSFYNDKNLPKQKSNPIETKTDNYSVSLSEESLPSVFFPVKYVLLTIIVLLILGLAGISWTAWCWFDHARKLQKEYNLLQENYENTKSSLIAESERLKKETKELHNELINEKKITEKRLQIKNSEIEKKDSEIKKLENDKNNLNLQLQTARQNADESLKIENESLKTKNDQLNNKINLIREHIETIHGELLPEK